jgi:CDP-glycerol glycerophosphotransferase (TagB/SpsB family)
MLCIHHSIEKYDKDLSTYHKNIDFFLEFFKMNQQKTCLFRPHPMLFSKLKSISNLHKINQLIDLDNITLDKNENFIDSFHSSSALITDVGSFLMIYPFMNKPMGITVNPGNNLGDDGYLFESNLLKTKEELSSFLNYPFERRFIIDSSSLNIVTENITQNIYNSLCAE